MFTLTLQGGNDGPRMIPNLYSLLKIGTYKPSSVVYSSYSNTCMKPYFGKGTVFGDLKFNDLPVFRNSQRYES